MVGSPKLGNEQGEQVRTAEMPCGGMSFSSSPLNFTHIPVGKNGVKPLLRVSLLAGIALYFALTLSCGGINFGEVQPQDLCQCVPLEPPIADFRHNEKHVPIPNVTPTEITVDAILGWPQDVIVLPDAPRTGRELQVFHVAQAFLQSVSVNGEDCDVNLEISQTADRNAPRVIVETPVDSEFCSARKTIQSQLAKHGFRLDAEHGGELPQALAAEVLGMAFEDFDHNRGSAQIATLWELHPATVNLLP
jgi:hypothetical protein